VPDEKKEEIMEIKAWLAKNKWLVAFIAAAVLLVASIVVIIAVVSANDTPDAPPAYVEGPETGVYYYETPAGDYKLSLHGGNKFTINGPRYNKSGEYTVSNETEVSFDFFRDEDGTATACGRFDVCVSPAYVYVRGNQLYTGEFYRAVDYETPEEHRLTTPAGDENTAIEGVYTLGADGMPVSASPDYVMSTTAQVQGMAFDAEGRLLLSTSWGLSKSYIYVYDLTNAATGTVTLDGEELTVKYVDSTCLKDTIVAPPMAEELVVRDGKLLIMNESASMKYIFGKLTSGNHVWAFDYSVVE
jgi:hypothetical protein